MAVQPVLSGPKGRFLLGSFREFNTDTLNFLRDQRQYGAVTRFYFGPFPVIVVNQPDYIHDVLITHADHYYKTNSIKQILAPVVGNGLFTSDGDFWKRQRRLVQPTFHTKRISAYARIMVDYANDLAATWQDGAVRPIDKDMTNLTMLDTLTTTSHR